MFCFQTGGPIAGWAYNRDFTNYGTLLHEILANSAILKNRYLAAL